MDFVMHRVIQDYCQCAELLRSLEEELQTLPTGYMTCRTIYGHCYYYVESKDFTGKRISKIIPKEKVEETKEIFQRKKFLRENIKNVKRHMLLLEQEYPQCKREISKDSQKIYHTYQGECVRSKAELIIANELYINQIPYEYEKPLLLKGMKKPIHPDFTIYTPHKHNVVYWEHCGLMNNQEYRENWEWRKQRYEKAGIAEWCKNLIVTYEAESGDFQVEDIRQHILCLLRS